MAKINAKKNLNPNKTKYYIRGIWAVTIIAALALIVVGITCYWTISIISQYQEMGAGRNPHVPTPPSSGSSNLPSASTVDETANWITYNDSTYNFTLKYPETWTTTGKINENDNSLIYIYSDEKFGPEVEPIQYYIWIAPTNKKPATSYSTTKVNDYTAYKTDQEPSRSGALAYYITKDENTYIKIAITPYDKNDPWVEQNKYISIFDDILSTFKFL